MISGLFFSNDLYENIIFEIFFYIFSIIDNDGDLFICVIENIFGIFLLKFNLIGSIIGIFVL